jgi:hypothetical protein
VRQLPHRSGVTTHVRSGGTARMAVSRSDKMAASSGNDLSSAFDLRRRHSEDGVRTVMIN